MFWFPSYSLLQISRDIYSLLKRPVHFQHPFWLLHSRGASNSSDSFYTKLSGNYLVAEFLSLLWVLLVHSLVYALEGLTYQIFFSFSSNLSLTPKYQVCFSHRLRGCSLMRIPFHSSACLFCPPPPTILRLGFYIWNVFLCNSWNRFHIFKEIPEKHVSDAFTLSPVSVFGLPVKKSEVCFF